MYNFNQSLNFIINNADNQFSSSEKEAEAVLKQLLPRHSVHAKAHESQLFY